MISFNLDSTVMQSMDTSIQQAFAKDYIYSYAVGINMDGVASAQDILVKDVTAKKIFFPVLETSFSMVTAGELDKGSIIPSDFVFTSKDLLEQLIRDIDLNIWLLYFGVNPDIIAQYSIKVTLDAAPAAPAAKLPLTYDAVKDAAFELMKANGTTSTLEVKELLRTKNYEATQAEVSKLMKEVAREESLDFNAASANGNNHIVYSIID